MKAPRFKAVKTLKGWRLNVPASLSPDGKRSRRFFQGRDEAQGKAAKLRTQLAQDGTGTWILPPAQADSAVRAFAMLGEDAAPETWVDAVREYINSKTRLASLPFEEAFKQFVDAQPRSASYAQSLKHSEFWTIFQKSIDGYVRCASESVPKAVIGNVRCALGAQYSLTVSLDPPAQENFREIK